MAVNIEDILLLRAQQKAAEQPNTMQVAAGGAALGAGLGLLAGNEVHQAGKAINQLKDRLAARQGLTRKGLPIGSRLPRTGARATGGLIGLILGGGLGAGTRQLMIQNSPEAALLAKVQTQDSFSTSEIAALQSVLGDAYNQTLAM